MKSIDDVGGEVLKTYASITISVQDLQLLKLMSSKNDFDYLEIDRILNVMFNPEKENIYKRQSAYNYFKSYEVMKILGNLFILLFSQCKIKIIIRLILFL